MIFASIYLWNIVKYKIWEITRSNERPLLKQHSEVLEHTLHYVHGQLLRYNYARYVAFQDPEIMKISLGEHKRILRALSDRNKKELKNLVKTHWDFLFQHMHLRNKFMNAFKGGEAAIEKKFWLRLECQTTSETSGKR